jgi:hypothetical protein
MLITLKLGNKNANPSWKFLENFLFYLVTLNPIKKLIIHIPPPEALFKTLNFLFKCLFLPEVVTNYAF